MQARAQLTREKVRDQIFSDTIGVSKTFEKSQLKSNKFYDQVLSSEKGFVRWIGNLLIGARSSADDAAPVPETEISKDYFERFSGRMISKIIISQANIFGQTENDDLSWTERALDNLHVRTREYVVRKNLMFHIGDTLDPYLFSINEQMLRNKDYIATAFFVILPDPVIPGAVEVSVFTRDNWSISAGGTLGGSPSLDVFDRNFVGSGNMLLMRYYGKSNDQDHGFETEYVIDNLLGSFAKASFLAGIGSSNNSLQIVLNRDFILPSDYIWGFRAGYANRNTDIPTMDTTAVIGTQHWGAHYGRSWNVNRRMGTGVYAIVSGNYLQYDNAPMSTATRNPYYTDRFTLSMNLGITRQNFFQGNMIYGYGRTEDIPYGFKFELIGSWEQNLQLGIRWYFGAEARWGGMTKAGYFNAGIRAGSYMKPQGTLEQAMVNASLNYFSPLWEMGNLFVRQFVTMRYTQGFNRLSGERERIGFNNPDVRGMGMPSHLLGVNRYVISTETVFFTPLFLYHFRFAFFGWFDCGWIGMNKQLFQNPFAAAVGLGVRIKNERLIFNNIQLRVGVSLHRLNDASYNWFQVSNESFLRSEPFTPQPPSPYPFE